MFEVGGELLFDGRSTEINLISFVNYFAEVLDDGGVVHAEYINSLKAFDRVNHSILLNELEAAGVQDVLL